MDVVQRALNVFGCDNLLPRFDRCQEDVSTARHACDVQDQGKWRDVGGLRWMQRRIGRDACYAREGSSFYYGSHVVCHIADTALFAALLCCIQSLSIW